MTDFSELQKLTHDFGLCTENRGAVLTNPPFGTKDNAGMDLRFLKAATRLARRTVYSFHKTSTRAFMKKHVESEWKMPLTVVAEMQFDIPSMYKFHTRQTLDVKVDLIRIDL